MKEVHDAVNVIGNVEKNHSSEQKRDFKVSALNRSSSSSRFGENSLIRIVRESRTSPIARILKAARGVSGGSDARERIVQSEEE